MSVRNLAATALLLFVAQTVADSAAINDETAQLLFERACYLEYREYAQARDVLASHGPALAPLWEKKAKSANWRERYLAELLLLRVREPTKATALRLAIHEVLRTAGPDDRLLARLDNRAGKTTLDSTAVSMLIDYLRELPLGNRDRHITPVLAALKHLNDPATAEAILYTVPPSAPWKQSIIDTLASFGKPALPALHRAVLELRERSNYRRAEIAIKAIAKIGDPLSGEALWKAYDPQKSLQHAFFILEAMEQLKPTNGAAMLFQVLYTAAFGDDRSLRQHEKQKLYLSARGALLAYGTDAQPTLERNSRSQQPVERQAIAAGLAAELAHLAEMRAIYEDLGREWLAAHAEFAPRPDGDQAALVDRGKDVFWGRVGFRRGSGEPGIQEIVARAPAPVLCEGAIVFRGGRFVQALGQFRGDQLCFDVLHYILVDSRASGNLRIDAIAPIAHVDARQALDVYRTFLIREGLVVHPFIDGILVSSAPEAGKLLEDVIATESFQKYVEPNQPNKASAIRRIAEVLKNRPEQLVELLTLEDPDYRFTVAEVLASRGDVRCVPVLFAEATRWVEVERMYGGGGGGGGIDWGGGFGEQNGPEKVLVLSEHALAAQQAIVKLGEPALAEIERTAAASKDGDAKLLAEMLKLSINRPDVVERYQRAMSYRPPDDGSHAYDPPDVSDYRERGKWLAEQVGDESIPLLEAEVAFSTQYALSAALALAEFGREESLQLVLAKMGRQFGIDGLAAGVVLDGFGQPGLAAAKAVPVPNPQRPAFAGRSGRHAGATSALVIANDVQGIEGVLAGLKLAAEGKTNARHATAYLEMAANYEDERLVPAIIAVVDQYDESVLDEAVYALGRYDDPQVSAFYLRKLDGGRGPIGADPTVVFALANLHGAEARLLLINELQNATGEDRQIVLIDAISMLHPDIFVNEEETAEEDAEKAVMMIRDVLIEQLKADSPRVQLEAASELADFMKYTPGTVTTKALVAWLSNQDGASQNVVEYLAKSRHPSVAPVLLKIYRRNPPNHELIGRSLVELNCVEARDAMLNALKVRLSKQKEWRRSDWGFKYGIAEVNMLAGLGQQGCETLFEFARDHDDLQFRVEAFHAVAAAGYQPAYGPIKPMLEELSRSDPRDVKFQLRNQQTAEGAYARCVELLARGLTAVDPQDAFPIVAQAWREVDQADAKKALGNIVHEVLRKHPEIGLRSSPATDDLP